MKHLLVLAVCLVLPLSIAAQSKDLDIKLTVEKIVITDGNEVLKPADKAKPGDVVQYTAVYTNQSNGTLRNLEPTLPIPQGMDYQAGSAKPAPVSASVDGKNFATIPLKRKVKGVDGRMVEQEVPPQEYRALRWRVGDLDARKSVTVAARAKVTSTRSVSLK